MRWLRRLVLVVILVPLVLVGGAYLWLWTSLPQTTGVLVVGGPSSEIRITRDAVGVPHIAAANDGDATFALGFVHAQDRLFQMDMMRRLGAGRLAEVLGEGAVGTDRTMRTLGLFRAAERQLTALSPPLRTALDAYAAGVNAYLAQGATLPPEYALLRTVPEQWQPADSLVWGKYMALLLSGNYRRELAHARIATHVTQEQLGQLFPDYPVDAPVTLAALFRALPLDRIIASLPDAVGPNFASNNWVVDGKHSLSGKPILANDPHRYLAPQGPLPFETRQEVIRVRRATPVTLTIRTTRHGPVISDLAAPPGVAPTGDILALQATFLAGEDRTPQALWEVNRASNWEEFNAALTNVVAPQQNIVYADVDGNIGFTAPARIPIRGAGDGWLPAPGWSGEHDWTGFIPFAELPRAFNPPNGRFVSANNKIVGDDYPYFIGRDWDLPYRVSRINALLDETKLQSPDTTAAIQADALSLAARDLLPLMLAIAPADAREAAALDRLKAWDGRMTLDQVAPLIFTAWLRDLNRVLFAERLGEAFADYWDLHPVVVAAILGEHQEWCSDPTRPGIVGCAGRLGESLHHAIDELTADFGSDMAGWRWGRAHAAAFPHPFFSRVPVLRDLLALTTEADGGPDTLNRGALFIQSAEQPYLDRHGAGFRMILDFADLDASRFIVVPGQSGNPLSAHYADLLKPWQGFSWLRLAQDATGETLVLEPQR